MSVSKLVEKIDADIFLESLSKLDPALKDILSSDIGGDLIEKIVVKYGVNLSHLPDLMMLFGLYVTKLIPPQEFIDYLATFVPDKYLGHFLRELEDKLWSPYDVYLNKAGVVYKQLLKLTPQKLTDNSELITDNKNQVAVNTVPVAETPRTSEVPVSIPVVPQIVDLSKPQEIKPSSDASSRSPDQNIGVTQSPVAEPPKPKPLIISDISPAGEKTIPEIPTPPPTASSEKPQARVKFDVPRVGPQILKPTESAFAPRVPDVKFVGPEVRPEAPGQVPPASAQWQRPEEKKVEIPKPPEVKKTEVAGRQVIDLTNFGLSKPDEE